VGAGACMYVCMYMCRITVILIVPSAYNNVYLFPVCVCGAFAPLWVFCHDKKDDKMYDYYCYCCWFCCLGVRVQVSGSVSYACCDLVEVEHIYC